MLVALVLRLFHLGSQSLWVDEILTWRSAAPTGAFDWSDFFANSHGPLVSALSHVQMRLLGQSEWALRLPFALATVLLVPVVARLAGRVAGPRAFLWGAWLVALSPLATWYGQEMRNYAFAFLFSALALDATFGYRASGDNRDLARLALWSALGILTNLNTGLLLPVLLVALLVSPPAGRNRWFAPLFVLGAVALVLSPWIAHYVERIAFARLAPGRAALPDETPLRGATTFTWGAIPYTFFVDAVGYTLGPSLRSLHAHVGAAALKPHLVPIVATGIVFGAVLLAGIVSLRRRPFAQVLCVAAIASPILAVTYFAMMNFKPYNPRYVASGLPAWWALLAAGFAALPGRARVLAAAAALLLCLASLRNHYFAPAYGKEDYRGAAAMLAHAVAPGDSVLATGAYAPFEYYRAGGFRTWWLGFAADARMEPKFEAALDTTGATWVVVARPEELDPAGRFERWLQQAHRPQVTTFEGIRVYRIAARPDSLR